MPVGCAITTMQRLLPFSDQQHCMPELTEAGMKFLPTTRVSFHFLRSAQSNKSELMNIIRKFAVVTLLGSAIAAAHAGSFQWGGTSSLNWSDVANWNVFPDSASSVPGPLDSVYFEDQLFTTGFTNVAGLVNNIVNTSTAIGSLNYTAQADYYGDSHFYTTLIPSGVTLTVGGLGTPALNSTPAAMSVGDVQFSGSWNDLDANYYATTNYSTITGAGTLKVTDTNSLILWVNFSRRHLI